MLPKSLQRCATVSAASPLWTVAGTRSSVTLRQSAEVQRYRAAENKEESRLK